MKLNNLDVNKVITVIPDISDILSDGFKLFFHNYPKLMKFMAPFYILIAILDYFIYGKVLSILYSRSMSSFFMLEFIFVISMLILVLLIKSILSVIAISGVSNFLHKKYIGEDVKLIDEIKGSFNRNLVILILLYPIIFFLFEFDLLFYIIFIILFFLTGAYLVFWIALFFCVILFSISILTIFFNIFLFYTKNLENLKTHPIKNARAIAKNSDGKNILVYFIVFFMYLFYLIILIIIARIFNFLSINSFLIIKNLFLILLAPLFICLLTPLFTHSLHINQKPQVRAIFCHSCGEKSFQNSNFCVKCGDQLIRH